MVPSRGNGRQPQLKCVACFQPTPSVCFGCYDCRTPPPNRYDVFNANSCVSNSSAIFAMHQVTVLAHRGTHNIFLTTASRKSSEWRPSVIAPVLSFFFQNTPKAWFACSSSGETELKASLPHILFRVGLVCGNNLSQRLQILSHSPDIVKCCFLFLRGQRLFCLLTGLFPLCKEISKACEFNISVNVSHVQEKQLDVSPDWFIDRCEGEDLVTFKIKHCSD